MHVRIQLLAMAAICCLVACGRDQAADKTEIENTARNFIKKMAVLDDAALDWAVSLNRPGMKVVLEQARNDPSKSDFPTPEELENLSVELYDLDDDDAMVAMQLKGEVLSIQLKREDGRWLVSGMGQ